MARVNEHYLKLKAGYLFPEIARRLGEYQDGHPDADIIKCGIGDVTEPLPQAVREAMHKAVDEMGTRQGFHGYGPEQGYLWLREKIAGHDFQARHCGIEADEIFVSDGSKCDSANILDILGNDNRIAVCDPGYPVYVDTNVMTGRTGDANHRGEYGGLVYLPMTEANNFTPALPSEPVDVIYLCYPNNPTGMAASRETLEGWVNYARENNALILFDAAYEAFITDPSIPHSIFEIEGARECAIEFRSFSKNAGFTGIRTALTIIPKTLQGKTSSGEHVPLHRLWHRRHTTKFNGVSYITQRGAEAVYSDEGRRQVADLVAFYLENARVLGECLTGQGFRCYGGVNAPYIWLKTPGGMGSWDFFDHLLNKSRILGTPGSGFGASGEGYFRLSAFNSRENIRKAVKRLKQITA